MITVVTDSSSYFKQAEAKALGIKIIPMSYTVDGQVYSESYSDQNGDFENLLKSHGRFSTAQPNLAAFLSCFEEELAVGNEVLCITISSRLSGSYSTAHAAAKLTGSGKVSVFDSRLTAGGLYLLAKKAQEWISAGFPASEVMQKLQDIRGEIAVAFSVDDIAPLRKSGRLGFVRMSVGTILNRKPVLLLFEGGIVSDQVVSGETGIIKRLVQKVATDAKEIVINYLGNNRLATNLYNVLKDAHPQTPISLRKLGPVLGIHLGVNAIAVSSIRLT